MQINPAVTWRILSSLRDAGFVASEKGHGGGWTLARDLAAITPRDVYTVLGSPALFAMSNRTESPGCHVEQAVNASLDIAFADAEALILDRLGPVTLQQLGFERSLRAPVTNSGRA